MGKPAAPTEDAEKGPLEVLAKEVGKADKALLAAYLEGTNDADLVDVGRKILSARVVTDASRLYGEAWAFWKHASAEQKKTLRGFSVPLLALAVHQAQELNKLDAAHTENKDAAAATREQGDRVAAAAFSSGIGLRDQAFAAMRDAAGRDESRVVFGCVLWGALMGAVSIGGCAAGTPVAAVGTPGSVAAVGTPGSCFTTNQCKWTYWGKDPPSMVASICYRGNRPAGTPCTLDPSTGGQCDGAGTCVQPASWELGEFRSLDNGNPNNQTLEAFVANLAHGDTFDPLPLGGPREQAFVAFINGVNTAIATSLTNPNMADWCTVRQLAATAGYGVTRFFDPTMQRWLIYAFDIQASALNQGQTTGHGYFFINPQPRRAIVLEAPHLGSPGSANENDTGRQGVFLFQRLAARALALNGATRCIGPSASDTNPDPTCGGVYTADVCGAGSKDTPYHVSDLAHSVTNAFHRFHDRFNADTADRFVQLHGRDLLGTHVTAGDGRNPINNTVDPSMSNNYVTALSNLIANLDDYSCQNGTSSTYCGATNVQARVTAGGTLQGNGCPDSQGMNGARFLHLEQGKGFLTPAMLPMGNNWPEIVAALRQITDCIPMQDPNCNVARPLQRSVISGLTCP